MKKPHVRHEALLLLEGETEEEFYNKLASEQLKGCKKRLKNLRGNFNINAKIVSSAIQFTRDNPEQLFDVYVCIDQERVGCPAYNEQLVLSELKKIPNFQAIFPVIANLMIESLFFIDIAGIYAHLRVEKKKRNPKHYASFRKLTHRDLSALFKQHGKKYVKGHSCQYFVESLNIAHVVNSAEELSAMVKNVQTRSR